jgi:iron complex outermembrane receptor protein
MNTSTIRDFYGSSYAIFGQMSYALTDNLEVIAGLRYEEQSMEFDDHNLGTSNENGWDQISPKIALQCHLTPEIMTYVSASQGYRSGGFNVIADEPEYETYDAETLWSYEVGLKSAFFDNRLILNCDVYYMDISDMQVEEAITPYLSYTTNAAEASAMGGEIELALRLADGLTVTAGFGYCDIEFDEFQDSLGNYEGNKNPYAPDYTFNLGAQYRHENGFYARAEMVGYGKMYLDKANEYSQDAHQLVNAKIGYETEHFDIYLYGENVFDAEHDAYGYYGGYYVVYGDPREIGLKLVYRF